MNVVLERYSDRWVVSIVHPLFGEIEIDDNGNVHRVERSVDHKRVCEIVDKLCDMANLLLLETGIRQKVRFVIQYSEGAVDMRRETHERLYAQETLKALLGDLNKCFQETP